MVLDMSRALYLWKKVPGSLTFRKFDNDNDVDDDDKEN
jgi:hypothetical protein